MNVNVAGETLVLAAERGAFWINARTLLVADPHFGKAATFRAGGVPVPSGTTANALQRLDALVTRFHPDHLILLGDFLHAREGRAQQTFDAIAQWRAQYRSLPVTLVRGNHDRRAGDPPPDLGIACVDGPLLDGPFAFAHHPVRFDGAYTIAGHVHPGVRLRGPGYRPVALPCFSFGSAIGILPAFGAFTGLEIIDPEIGDRIFAIAENEVVAIRPR